VARGEHQGRATLGALLVDGGSILEQQLRDTHVAAEGSDAECALAVPALHVDGARRDALKQSGRYLRVAHEAGVVQGLKQKVEAVEVLAAWAGTQGSPQPANPNLIPTHALA